MDEKKICRNIKKIDEMRVIEVEIEMKYRRMRNENERMKFSHWLISTKLMRILQRRSFEFSLLNFSIKLSLLRSLQVDGWIFLFCFVFILVSLLLLLFFFRCLLSNSPNCR